MEPLPRSTLAILTLAALTFAALPAAQAAGPTLCEDDANPCVERTGLCVSAVYWLTYDFGASVGHCPVAAQTPHGTGACHTAWAVAGGYGGVSGVVTRACAGLDTEGNGCVTLYLQLNEDGSTFKPLCLA